MSGTANISDLAFGLAGGQRWAMVRTHFGITAFGVNAYVADEAGSEVIGEHDELGERSGNHEELYFVSQWTRDVHGQRGRDRRAFGHLRLRPRPCCQAQRSRKGSRDDGAYRRRKARRGVLALPVGAKRVRRSPTSPRASTTRRSKSWSGSIGEDPEDAGVLYNLACAESMSGKGDQAVEHLGRAVELDTSFGELAEKDSDFDPIRDDPGYASAVAGKPDAGGASS